MGAWNTRSLIGKEEEIVEQMITQEVEILAVTEIKKKGNGIMIIHKGYWSRMDRKSINGRGIDNSTME